MQGKKYVLYLLVLLANDAVLLLIGQSEDHEGYLAGEALAVTVRREWKLQKSSAAQIMQMAHVLDERCGGMTAGVTAFGKSTDNTFNVPVNPKHCDAWKNEILEK